MPLSLNDQSQIDISHFQSQLKAIDSFWHDAKLLSFNERNELHQKTKALLKTLKQYDHQMVPAALTESNAIMHMHSSIGKEYGDLYRTNYIQIIYFTILDNGLDDDVFEYGLNTKYYIINDQDLMKLNHPLKKAIDDHLIIIGQAPLILPDEQVIQQNSNREEYGWGSILDDTSNKFKYLSLLQDPTIITELTTPKNQRLDISKTPLSAKAFKKLSYEDTPEFNRFINKIVLFCQLDPVEL